MKYAKFLGIVAVAIMLCGCTSKQFKNIDSSTDISTSLTSSSDNSNGEVIYSSSSVQAEYTVSEKHSISASDTFDVYKDDTVYIVNGGELTVDGKMTSENGGKIIIENGGVLILNSEAQLDCDLTIEKGGKLIIGENGKVSGSGTIYTFSNDCIENSKNIESNIKITG